MSALIDAIRAMDAAGAFAALPQGAHDRDEHGVSVLLLARYRGLHDVVAAIVEARGEGDLDLYEAAALDHVTALAALVAADGADRPDLGRRSPDGFPALALAAHFDATRTAALLLRHGADVHARAEGAMTVQALHAAAASPTGACLPLLIAAGADLDAGQRGGFTALHELAHRGLDDHVELLLAAGADPTRRTDDGRTPADVAEAAGHTALAARLRPGAAHPA